MKVLFIGDVVGEIGRQMIEDHLYRIKKEKQIDFVIANVEMPNVFFINSLYLFNDITNVRIGSTAFYTKIHIATRPTANYPV